jgi:hypothetical protein
MLLIRAALQMRASPYEHRNVKACIETLIRPQSIDSTRLTQLRHRQDFNREQATFRSVAIDRLHSEIVWHATRWPQPDAV